MRYLITGGAGFIGSHLVHALLDRGEDVVVIDDFSTGRRANLEPYEARITLHEADISERDACRRAMEGVDYVLHQAALGSVPRSIADPIRTHEVNATGTLNLLAAARETGVKRVVFAGSSSAYGDTEELPKREEMQPRARSPYAVSKLAGEQYCRAFWHSYGLETVALRYFNVFGPRQDLGSQYAAVIPRFIVAALGDEEPLIYGDGEQTRDFTFIDNVVQANLLALEAPTEAMGEVFNVGYGQRTSINRLWEIIRTTMGSNVAARHEPGRTGDVRDSLASLDRSRRLLGYDPEVGLEEGLNRTVDHYGHSPAGPGN